MGLAAALATERVSRTMAHQAAEDAARGTARLPQPPPVVEEVPMRASPVTRSETTRVVTRTDAPPDPVQQALREKASIESLEKVAGAVARVSAHVDAIEARSVAAATEQPYNLGRDVLVRLTSRKLWVTIAGLVLAIVTTAHGEGWPLVVSIAGIAAAYVIGESHVDAQTAKNTPAPAPPQAPAHGES